MTIGLGQILLIILIVIVLFGKFPGLSRDLLNGITNLQNLLRNKEKSHLDSDSSESQKTQLLDSTSDKKVTDHKMSDTPNVKDTKDIK